MDVLTMVVLNMGPPTAIACKPPHGMVTVRRWLCAIALFSLCAANPARAQLSAPELELELARSEKPYLILDLEHASVSICMRGRKQEEVPLDTVQVLRASHLNESSLAPLDLPTVWHVARRPPSRRPLKAPAKLTREAPPQANDTTASLTLPLTTPSPDVYTVPTLEGWWVELGRGRHAPGLVKRWQQSVADAWARFRSEQPAKPDRLVLGLPPESAARLHHLFRQDIAILVVGGCSSPATAI